MLPRLNVNGDAELNRFAEQIKERLCNYSAQDLKKNESAARGDGDRCRQHRRRRWTALLREPRGRIPAGPSADDIFTRMSAYMEAPAV